MLLILLKSKLATTRVCFWAAAQSRMIALDTRIDNRPGWPGWRSRQHFPLARWEPVMNRSGTSFEYEDAGRTRRGTYIVSHGKHPVITVNTEFGSKATQVGGSPPDFLAKQIAIELVAKAKIKRSQR